MRAVVLALLLGALASACSLLIAGEPMPLRCSQEGQLGPPACDPGMVCRSGICQVSADAGEGGSVSDPDDRRN